MPVDDTGQQRIDADNSADLKWIRTSVVAVAKSEALPVPSDSQALARFAEIYYMTIFTASAAYHLRIGLSLSLCEGYSRRPER